LNEAERIKHIKKYDLYYDFSTNVQKHLLRKKGMSLSYNNIYRILQSWGMGIRIPLVYNNSYAYCADHIYNNWYQTYADNKMFYPQKPFPKKTLDTV